LFFSSNPGFKKSFLFTRLDAEKPVIRVNLVSGLASE
jgi:hypothetical protein